MATGADQGNMPFIKNLASSDRKTRQSSLATLRTYLLSTSTSSRLTQLDHLKLWKGLFYSLWMCDRPIPQQNLCAELAELVTSALPQDAAAAAVRGRTGEEEEEGKEAEDDELATARAVYPVIGFLEGFWITMAREWTSIDVLRMEKFLLLVRRVFGAGLAWATTTTTAAATSKSQKQQQKGKKQQRQKSGRKGGGGGGEEEQQGKKKDKEDALIALLAALPFDGSGDLKKMPVGVRLHVMDIWVDECEKVGLLPSEKKEEEEEDQEEEEEEEEEEKGLLERIRGLVEGQLKSPSKPVRSRAGDSLADERLPWNEKDAEGAEEGEEDGEEEGQQGGDNDGGDWGGFDD